MNAPLRIVVNTRILLKDRLEGVGWFTLEVLQRLTERNPTCEFLFLFDRLYDPSFVFGANVRPIIVPPPARHPLLWYWWFNWAVPQVMHREKPDLFLSTDGHCSLNTKVPTLMVIHDIAHEHFPEQVPWMARQYYDYFIPRYLERAQRILTVSGFSKLDIVEHYRVPSEKISVCGNGVRPGFQPLTAAEKVNVREQYSGGKDYFFYLGSVNPRKNVVRLIQAYDQFRAETKGEIKLLIGGRFGWLTGTVKAAYEQARYSEDILFMDYIPEAELPRLMGAALALTYVSLFEGFGIPLIEAMQAEVPVITSDLSAMPEVAGDAALLVDPYDVGAITRALHQINDTPDLRRKLVEKGKLQRQKFSWEKTTTALEQALFTLAND